MILLLGLMIWAVACQDSSKNLVLSGIGKEPISRDKYRVVALEQDVHLKFMAADTPQFLLYPADNFKTGVEYKHITGWFDFDGTGVMFGLIDHAVRGGELVLRDFNFTKTTGIFGARAWDFTFQESDFEDLAIRDEEGNKYFVATVMAERQSPTRAGDPTFTKPVHVVSRFYKNEGPIYPRGWALIHAYVVAVVLAVPVILYARKQYYSLTNSQTTASSSMNKDKKE